MKTLYELVQDLRPGELLTLKASEDSNVLQAIIRKEGAEFICDFSLRDLALLGESLGITRVLARGLFFVRESRNQRTNNANVPTLQ